MIGIRGREVGNEDDPIWFVPPSAVYDSLYPGGLTKPQREDLQIIEWLTFMISSLAIDSPVSLSVPDSDPPDRHLITTQGRLGVELTELTQQPVREALAPLSRYGKRLQALLNENIYQYSHLLGRRIHLTFFEFENDKIINLDSHTDALLQTLTEDVGVFGEGIELSIDGGPPQVWPTNSRGIYPRTGPFIAQVYPDGAPETILTVCNVQVQVQLSEAVAALQTAIRRKDRPGNDIVLITCGLPSDSGYVCPIDQFLYDHIEASRLQIAPQIQLNHSKCVILRLWGSPSVIELYRHPEVTIPWKAL